MSGYWDAVSRAARGLPGSAEPRSPSIFEPEGPGLTSGGFEAMDEEIDAQAVMPSRGIAGSAPVLMEPGVRAVATSDDDRDARARKEPPANATSSAPAGLERRTRDREPETAEPLPRPLAAAPPTPRGIERVEVHRIETTHTVIEPHPILVPAEPPVLAHPAPGSEPAASWEQPEADQMAEPRRAPEADTPQVVVAEPRAQPREADALAVVPEALPPLVIEIDRIDIRIESAAAPPPVVPRRRDPGPVPSLNDYLARRSEAGR